MKTNVQNCKTYLRILDTIINQIADGTIKYDEKFYTEQELTNLFQVSRPTLREALRVLEFLGITTVKPHRGIYIHHPVTTGGYPALRHILTFEQPSQQELAELCAALAQVPAGNKAAAKLIETVSSLLSEERKPYYD